MPQSSQKFAVIVFGILAGCAPQKQSASFQKNEQKYEICTQSAGCNSSTLDQLVNAEPLPQPKSKSINFIKPDGYLGEPLDQLQQAALSGDEIAAYKLGLAYSEDTTGPEDGVQVVRWLSLSADAGYAPAQYELATYLLAQENPTPEDNRIALNEMSSAAKSEYPPAETGFGEMLFSGKLIAPDPSRAAILFDKAAAKGDQDAKFYLGQMYMRGKGKPLQFNRGVQVTREAAEGGSVIAQRTLGLMFLDGFDTVRSDEREAKRWLQTAAQAGDPHAVEILEIVKTGGHFVDGPARVFLPVGDFIEASKRTENLIQQAKSILSRGGNLDELAPIDLPGGGSAAILPSVEGNDDCVIVINVDRIDGKEVRQEKEQCFV